MSTLTDMSRAEECTNSAGFSPSQPLQTGIKINYGLGDFGNNIVWQMLSIWLAVFYTDVYGLHPVHVGTMYLAVRIFDAITDPLVGYWVDKTRSKHGSCRPFIMFGTVPLALSFTMVFYTPDFSEGGKLIYAYASFALLSLTYTLVNVPYSAMAGFLTRDSDERTLLQSYRFGLGMLASVFVSYAMLPLVAHLGDGDDQLGYLYAAAVFSLLIVICLYYCVFRVQERYAAQPLSENQQGSVKDLYRSISQALGNRQLAIVYSVSLLFFTTLTIKATVAVYYINHVLLDASDRVAIFLTWGSVGATLGAALSAYLWTRFDKVRSYQALMFCCAILSAIPYWLPGSEFVTIMLLGVVVSFLSISMVPLTWSMLSDLVDYQQVLSGKNMAGVIFALFLFVLKLGLGIGGAVSLWVLGASGYNAELSEQSPQVIDSINFIGTLLPGLIFLAAGVIMMFYKLDKAKREEIRLALYGA